MSPLIEDRYGIPTPPLGQGVSVQSIDVTFTPLISFDRQGNRIGYGSGFYDRFFQSCPKKVHRVGLAITPPLDEIPDTSTHDIPLHRCITHQQSYTFAPV